VKVQRFHSFHALWEPAHRTVSKSPFGVRANSLPLLSLRSVE
jgi:hypothetical protein